MNWNWREWEGKYIFVRLKSNTVYSGKVISVSEEENGICFLKIIDKFGSPVTFVNSEILEIKEKKVIKR